MRRKARCRYIPWRLPSSSSQPRRWPKATQMVQPAPTRPCQDLMAPPASISELHEVWPVAALQAKPRGQVALHCRSKRHSVTCRLATAAPVKLRMSPDIQPPLERCTCPPIQRQAHPVTRSRRNRWRHNGKDISRAADLEVVRQVAQQRRVDALLVGHILRRQLLLRLAALRLQRGKASMSGLVYINDCMALCCHPP